MAKKPFCLTVSKTVSERIVVWAEDERDAIKSTESLVNNDEVWFSPQWPDVIVEEVEPATDRQLECLDQYGKEVSA